MVLTKFIIITENNMYKVIQWPDIQHYMELPGFREHSYLINDDKGQEDFGSSAYFVEIEWLKSVLQDLIIMDYNRGKLYHYKCPSTIEISDETLRILGFNPDEVAWMRGNHIEMVNYETNKVVFLY